MITFVCWKCWFQQRHELTNTARDLNAQGGDVGSEVHLNLIKNCRNSVRIKNTFLIATSLVIIIDIDINLRDGQATISFASGGSFVQLSLHEWL